MKNKYSLHTGILLLACLLSLNTLKAQYVTIPDTAFANWLNTNGFSTCMNGNQMDTTCFEIGFASFLDIEDNYISDLTGMQYFKNITGFQSVGGGLTFIPGFPNKIKSIYLMNAHLGTLPALPDSLTYLYCLGDSLTLLPTLPAGLRSLQCDVNQLTSLPALPDSLTYLSCSIDSLTSLPALPYGLRYLQCNNNQITNLPILPATDTLLNCGANLLTSLPTLPSELVTLVCSKNQINNIPGFPVGLKTITCAINQLINLPPLPDSLLKLICDNNQLASLPPLPQQLSYLSCANNLITSALALPPALSYLSCNTNKISSITSIPNTLYYLDIANNPISYIPDLPDSLNTFNCGGDSLLSCLPQLKRIVNFNFTSTPLLHCLPDYGMITNSYPQISTYPLCDIFNGFNCNPFWTISGKAYYDANGNCLVDSSDTGVNSLKIFLDSAGAIVQQVYTNGGDYSFLTPYGNYSVYPDTSNLPYSISCPDSGYLSADVNAVDSLSFGNDFAFKCRTNGFDLGIQSLLIILEQTLTPTTLVTIHNIAGDMTQAYGAHCAAGISGQYQITITGPATIVGPAAGALTPSSQTSTSITWNVSDFGTINNSTAFNYIIAIDSSAVIGDQICITADITPTAGDINPANNHASLCCIIGTSYDPNEKEVSPSGNIDSTTQWLTYTIRFQNTGTAPAVNIYVIDTLSPYVDPSSFQLLAYSAHNLTQIFGNVVRFNFPNINLPDSATSDSASRGYVQYKVKLKDNLPLGTQISNTAYIYFDLNPAVVTNTVSNTIANPSGINEVGNTQADIKLYPNPATNQLYIHTDNFQAEWISLYNINGQKLSEQKFITKLDISNLSAGIYFVELKGNGLVARRRFVKM